MLYTLEGVTATGTMEAVIFPTVYAKYSNVIKTGTILKIEGKISLKEGERPKILASTLKEMTKGVKKIYIKINEDIDEKEALDKVVSNVITTDGSIPIYLYFEEKDELLNLVTESLSDDQNEKGNGIQVYIGNEAPVQTMKDCSIVTATYDLGEGVKGTIGIVGPKRMDYENVVDNLKNLKSQLDGIFEKNKQDS